jgi:hypothetical protein
VLTAAGIYITGRIHKCKNIHENGFVNKIFPAGDCVKKFAILKNDPDKV